MNTSRHMLAAQYAQHGAPDVVTLKEVPVPQLGRNQVLVRVVCCALNPKDILQRKGKFSAFSGPLPKRIGYDFAGVVAATSPDVVNVSVEQPVFGMLNGFRAGTAAQYVAAKAEEWAPVPLGVSLLHAAAVPLTALTALQALRDRAKLQGGQRVLIHGAAGGVGVMAIQIAKALGATVTTTSGEANRSFCTQLGADETLDYRVDQGLGDKARFDVVFDVFGNLSFAKVKRALTAHGRYVSTVPSFANFKDSVMTVLSAKKSKLVVVKCNRADLTQLSAWLANGQLQAVVDTVLPFAETTAAQVRLETKHARGKVLLRVAEE